MGEREMSHVKIKLWKINSEGMFALVGQVILMDERLRSMSAVTALDAMTVSSVMHPAVGGPRHLYLRGWARSQDNKFFVIDFRNLSRRQAWIESVQAALSAFVAKHIPQPTTEPEPDYGPVPDSFIIEA
jgi:hypothetical protein